MSIILLRFQRRINQRFPKEQLGFTYARIAFDKDVSSKIRNWCITVWVGSIAFASSQKIPLTAFQYAVLHGMPLLFFWFLDALQHTFVSLHSQHAKMLERFLLGIEDFNAARVEQYSLGGAMGQITYGRKLRLFLYCAFATETVSAFYFSLILGTFLFYAARA